MHRRSILGVIAALCISGAAFAEDPPPLPTIVAYAEHCGRFTIAPGGGEDLVDPGAGNDYRIQVIVYDDQDQPVEGIPATDVWVWHEAMVTCPGDFSQADGPTDALGKTSISGTVYGGIYTWDASDCDEMLLEVYVLGIVANFGEPVCVAIDSPDLNGDLTVNVADFPRFATDFNCASSGVPCEACHDYNEDGETNLADLAIFAGYLNDSVCP